MRHYLTSADAGYLPRLKVLHASMVRHCGPFLLHVLALGPEVEAWGRAQPTIEVLPVGRLIARRPEIGLANLPGPPRTRVDEQLCTWRWFAAVELLGAGVDSLTCIDADAMFWGSPEELLAALDAQRAPLAVMPHALARAADRLPGICVEDHGHFGTYNGGFVYFGDAAPAATLAEYVRQWCYPTWREHGDGRRTYGDQGYLDLVVEQHRATVLDDPGFITAPWNLNRHRLTVTHDGSVFVDGLPLVWFHYQGFAFEQAAYPSYALTAANDQILYNCYRRLLAEAVQDGLKPV